MSLVFRNHKSSCLKTEFDNIPAYTFSIKVKDAVTICYVAVRGKDQEEGAVQRPLNQRRINDIRAYILDGNTFFNSFIINWTEVNKKPINKKGEITLPIIEAAAQVIDGQHRLAGLEAAMEINADVGERDILMTLCIGLTTPEAAKIFLNINTEQRPAPKSLIYDLFGEVIDDEDHAINRTTDIARTLNEDIESPIYKLIKFPGAPRGQGYIELSTFVSAFKDHLKKDGTFQIYKLRNYERQRQAISNYFSALKSYYSENGAWDNKSKNPFIKAAGFNGAVEFFIDSLIKRCAEKASFSVMTMKSLINLDKEGLITWEDLKGLDGKTARKRIKDLLESNLINSLPDHSDYEF